MPTGVNAAVTSLGIYSAGHKLQSIWYLLLCRWGSCCCWDSGGACLHACIAHACSVLEMLCSQDKHSDDLAFGGCEPS